MAARDLFLQNPNCIFKGINSIPDSTKKSGQRLVGDVDYDDVSCAFPVCYSNYFYLQHLPKKYIFVLCFTGSADVCVFNRIDIEIDIVQVAGFAGYLTPVPGGVGPMTVAMLMYNTVQVTKYSYTNIYQGLHNTT